MTVIAGVDVGNATTEVVLVSGGKILGAGRVPTRGRKGSAGSLRGAAALVRRLERGLGATVGEARIAPLRAVDTAVVTVPDAAGPAGRLRVLAAGVRTPGGTGVCVGPPLPLGDVAPPGAEVVAIVPAGLRYDEAAARLRTLLAAGTRIGAVLVAGDEGVLVANRLPGELPVIDQVDAEAAAACRMLAVEVRPPGHMLRVLADPVALGARLGLDAAEAGDVAALSRVLADQANAVVGLLPAASAASGARCASGSTAGSGSRARTAAGASWTPRRPPRRRACSRWKARAAGCRSTGTTARENGAPSGCGSSRPCSRRTSGGQCGRSARTRRRSSWWAARPVTRNCSACWPARCRTAWPSAAAMWAAPARAARSATATPSRSA